MKKLLSFIAAGMLVGCLSHVPEGSGSSIDAAPASVQTSSRAASGQEVAAVLTARYRDTRSDCGAASKPAFLCSGIMLRGTLPTAEYDAWDPSPISVRNGGVSFTFVRSDYKVKRLRNYFQSGFIFYPILSTPEGKEKIEILCFFPVDGSSNARPNGGCDEHPNYPVVSKSCELQNPIIDTGEKWAAKYRADIAAGRSWAEAMCSFNVRDSANNVTASRFLEGMRGGRLISPAAFDTPNDTKLKTWSPSIPRRLPIEAFFYISAQGLPGAQLYQRRFRALTNITIPIIYLTLPQTLEQSATFSFKEADQTR